MGFIWLLFSFEGRINRAKYWLAGLDMLGLIALLAGLMFGASKLLGIPFPTTLHLDTDDIFRFVDPAAFRSAVEKIHDGNPAAAALMALLFQIVGAPVLLWVYAATSVKRLHDRNKSGWWLLPFFVLPGLYNQFENRLPDSYAMVVPALVIFILMIWGFIEMVCLRGTPATNRFGPDPLASSEPDPSSRPRWDQQSELEFVPYSAGPPAGAHVKREP
jgi:uncharacterized membrane protein YhaH (DUF805 family)